jgi:flagellar FliL protein
MVDAAIQPAVDAEVEVQAKPGKSRKWLIAGALAALLALGGGGGAYYYFVARTATADHSTAAQKSSPKTAEKAARKPMLYVPMETFTVNLTNADQERYLQVTITLEVPDTSSVDIIKQQMPAIRNAVLLLLSSKDARELMTREGKEKLSAELTAELRKTIDGAGPNKGLEQILFSHFVIQ